MSQLDLLWELECRSNQLEDNKRKLDNLNNNLELNKLKQKIQLMNNRFIELNKSLEDNKLKIYKSSNLLKDYEFKLKSIEVDLYNGKVSDLKQLNYLSDEKSKLTTLIEDIETEILTKMETNDLIIKEISILKEEIIILEKRIKQLKKKFNRMSEELSNKIDVESNEIDLFTKKIDSNIIGKYILLRKSKGTGIVYVKNQICGGCNMHIPTFMWEKLKLKQEILYCEFCGRILYFEQDNQ